LRRWSGGPGIDGALALSPGRSILRHAQPWSTRSDNAIRARAASCSLSALESAQSYIEMSGFSKQSLIEQLSSSAGEKFTSAQARYAVNKVY
jgi:hypothetical protein